MAEIDEPEWRFRKIREMVDHNDATAVDIL